MAGQKFTLTFDANLNVSQMKGALADIQKGLNNLNLPQNITKGLQDTFNRLSKEVQNFEVLTSKDLTGKMDTRKIENSANKISNLFKTLQIQIKDLSSLSGKSLEKLFPDNAIKSITAGENALKSYNQTIKQIESTLTGATKKVQEWQDKLAGRTAQRNTQAQVVEDLKAQVKSVSELASAQGVKQSISDYKELEAAIQQAKQNIEDYNNAVANGDRKANQITARGLQNVLTKLEATKNAYDQQANAIKAAEALLKSYDNAVNGAQQKIAEFQATLDRLNQTAGQDKAQALTKLFQDLNNAGFDTSKYKQDLEGAKQAVDDFKQSIASGLTQSVQAASDAINNNSNVIERNTQDVRENSAAQAQLDARMRDVSSLKSRIQYFFGLNNTINLFRNAVRGAFETIKELDKAMTETAVVTNFSVGDMWKQLPEYTKRANELGVTTKAAYEAATLYYQQGLTTEEVNALSVETLKMARIAGLDAAEATDRMTNALRGFNMELNEVNAERVDDVYSKLAAISASNVDEISTAMTKVASLAHNAGMEFETTAAFLAQIIETTRESAETAGTALKTVVARFTEVKKLVNEGELKGQDDEGELIDVNKVSAALRTAGIDLNRYFLGEVGIDDIFMELAEKWDSLTSLQQRYIATQAAGSRQQSRFIALLSDYARTQELVGAAYNANGAAAEQFGKTQESLESKLARLKNAWNEFLMGLTNSTVVKAGVDTLTTLLNIVNKLTSAFGEGVGSVMKWALAIAALRGVGSFVSAGGGLERLIGTMTGGRGLVGGVGRGFGGGLGALWGGAKNLGYLVGGNFGTAGAASGAALTGGAGIAAGLTGIVTALGAIAAAVGAVVLAYKAWEKFTPQGQLKTATKLAEQMQENAKQANDIAKGYKDVQENYKQYTDAVKEANSITERDAAIKSQNDYILSLIEKDSTYAKYLKSRTENGRIVLTLDSETLAKDTEEAAKKASEETTKSYFANAEQQRKQAEVYSREAYRAGIKAENLEADNRDATDLRAEQIAKEAAEETAKASMAAQARLGYQTMLGESGLSDSIKDLLATTLSQVFEETGQISDSQLTTLTAWASSANAQKIMSLLTGDIGDTNLLGKNDDQMLEALGFGKASGALDQFATLLGLDNKELKKNILNVAQTNKEIQENNRQRLAAKLNGLSPSTNYDEFFTNTAPSLQQTILNALEGAESLLAESGQKTLADILVDPSKTEDEIVAIQTFINGINFDKPINAYTRLQEGLNSTNEDIRLLAQQILTSNKDIFNSGNLIRTGLAEAYEEVGEEIDKLIEKNGEITTDDIDDLAKSSSALTKLLKLGIGNASTFAKALTLVGQGKINFDNLNDSLLNVLDNAQTFGSIISDIHNLIANFDEGIDYGEGVDFLIDKIEELNELTENFEFGNQRTEKLWNLFFGQDYKEAWAQGEDYIRGRITQMQGWLDNDAYGFFSDTGIMSALGISSSGDHKLDWDLSKYANYDALLNDIARAGGNLSTDAAKILLTQFASHGDLDFATQLEDLSYKSITGAIQKSYKTGNGKTILTNADIQAIADSYGLSFQKVSDYLKTHLDNYINIDEQGISGENLYQYFIKQLGGKFDPKQFVNDLFPDGVIDLTQLRSHLASMGYTDPNQQADLANSIMRAAGIEDGQVELNDLQLKIANLLNATVEDPVVQAITKALQDAAQGLDIEISDINLLLSQLSPETAANLMQAISQLVQADPSNYLVLQSLTATITDLNLPPEQAAAILTNLATQLTSGEPINLNQLKVTLTDLGLTQQQVNNVINTLQGYIDSSGNLVLPEVDTTSFEKSVDNARSALAQLWEDFKNSENYVPNRSAFHQEDVITFGEETVDQASISSALQNGVTDGVASGMTQGQTIITTNINEGASASSLESILATAMNQAGVTGAASIKSDIESNSYIITVDWTWGAAGPPSITNQAATGGVVRSSANGSHSLNAGISLTGEEGEEIVWNKERGYAYVTGSNGPEFRQLNPGDRVFNANETARILARSFARGGIYYSLASGRWNPKKDSGGSGGGSGSGSGSSSGSSSSNDDKGTEWKNEIDWIYNLMEDIEELERKQTKLQEDYEDYLQDQTKNGKDLYNLLIEQLGNLYTQLNHQQAALELREREMREFMDTTNQFDNLLWYNWNDRTLEIDWDQIEAIQDKDTYDQVSDLVSEAESIQKKIDDADDSIMDIKNQIQELENIWRDTYVDFESRVFDAVVSYYQKIIDNYSELHDTLSNSNSAILSAIQKQIALERQIRDNTQTEENIADTEAQLAFLRRDTTGGNELASLQLQKELSDQRQSYEDTLIDQAISRLQDDNEAAAEQRQKQIEIMQAQLDYQQQSGEFNAYVRELLETAMGADGELLTNSDLMTLLKDQENWSAMSEVSKQVWEDELNTTFKEVAAFILKQNAEENGTFISALTGAIQGMTAAIGSKSQPSVKIDYSSGSGGGGGGGGGSGGGGGGVGIDSGRTSVNADKVYVYTGGSGGWTDRSTASRLTANDIVNSGYFASGGLTSRTGPAWLDGTFSEPEYVLNARQTDAFLRLADVLPNMMQGNNTTTTTFGGINLNLVMNVDQIASDYDVDRIADRVKDIVYNAGQYRNVNTLNFIR